MKIPFLTILLTILTETIFSQNTDNALEKCSLQLQQAVGSDHANMEKNFTEGWKNFTECVYGIPFPNFKAVSMDGTIYTLNQIKGKVILINTWFIGCPPCEAELPSLAELSQEFTNDEFMILAFGKDNEESSMEYKKQHPMPFPIFNESEDLIRGTFKIVSGYPTNILLDRKGKIIFYKAGGAIEESGVQNAKEEFRALIKKELSKKE